MKKGIWASIALALLTIGATPAMAQTTSASNNLVAQPIPHRTVSFNVLDAGTSKPIIWGLDTAWPSESNMRRGIAFMGAERVDIVRASFQPTYPLVNDDLQTPQINDLNYRLNLIDLVGPHATVTLNCDHPSVDPWYIGNAARWAQLMDVTTRRVQERGRTVVSIAPFNEPDYGWGQYSGSNGQIDFYNICGELRNNARFDNIRLIGGNTLNNDQALPWYNYLKGRLDEGNTHQLAGSFDNFASFYQTVRANGDHASGDELHNVMEAMVGVEYGMQTGIWWGTAELARGEFVKASDGVRLGYAEHRPNWTAASVYRNTEGKVQAFGGTSERQAVSTTYRFVSMERDVYYDGNGPQREYTMALPGGTGYQTGQTNAERVVNITRGDDIQPVIGGKYMIVNRNSGQVIEVAGGSLNAGANVRQYTNAGATYQQWNVTPVDSRIGGDYSYFTFTAVHSGNAIDVQDWSLNNGANLLVWDDAKGSNQQWYLDYAGDGWFYIRSRHSAKCLEVANNSTSNGANIQQWDKDGGSNQQWRFLPVGTTVEFVAPVAPTNLVATPNAESIRLDWSASPDADVSGYTIYRSETAGGQYQTIARNVASTSFVDNTTTMGESFFYTVKAVDKALNRSAYSNETTATATGANALVAHIAFEENTHDNSVNLNHAATLGNTSFVNGKVDAKAIALDGSTAFVQLPATVANQQEMTIATWVYWNGGSAWQRIFDFGNGENNYMFLTPRANTGQMRFAIKNGGAEQQVNLTALTTGQWVHLAVTLDAAGAHVYVNGALVAESGGINIKPTDFKPVLNYIGRSQFADPLLNGRVDDFRIYNYALSADEVAQLVTIVTDVDEVNKTNNGILSVWPNPANEVLNINYASTKHAGLSTITVFDANGRLVMRKEFRNNANLSVNVSDLTSGVYLVRLTNNDETKTERLIVRR